MWSHYRYRSSTETGSGLDVPNRRQSLTGEPSTAASKRSPEDVPFTEAGFGGRFAWNFNDTLALEAASDLFPANRHNVLRGGRKFQMLAGPRIGWRFERLGVFGKARAGVARIGEGRQEGICVALAVFPPSEDCLVVENRLAFEIGGGFAIYPTPRTSVRLDAGDLMTRISRTTFHLGGRPNYSHWLQISTGFGVTF